MTDDVCACGGQITKVTSNNRLLSAKTSQELTATNTEATYRWITYTTNARILLADDEMKLSGIENTSVSIPDTSSHKLALSIKMTQHD